MGGFGEHVGIIGDWMPPSPSPSPRSLFLSGMLGDDAGSRSVVSEHPKGDNNNNGGFTFSRQGSERGEDDATKSGEQKRGGLVQRMAARSGYTAPTLNTHIIRPSAAAGNQQSRSPYLTIPPGLSPTTLLDSPVFLSNSLVQPSPTTGKFQFPNGIGNGRSSMMFSETSDTSKDSFFEDFNTSSFAFKPVPDSAPFSHGPVNPAVMFRQSFPSMEVSGQTQTHIEPAKVHSQNETSVHLQSDFSIASNEKKAEGNNLSLPFEGVNGDAEHKVEDDDSDQRMSGDNGYVNGGGSSEDGYNWRKYGQKQVKGSEYPRSYYKCTHSNCPVKKKVERSHEGHITEIIYKGAHNHPKLSPNRRQGIGSSGALCDMVEQGGDPAPAPAWTTDMQQQQHKGNNTHWGQESNLEVASSAMVLHGQRGAQLESSDAVDASSTFSNDEDDDDRATHGSVSLVCDGEEDESESKRRKVEAYASDVSGATRAIREPRVVVQTTSEVDILDDGYRWRKYGQKVVKGNPNPRSYYKCTSTGCTVRKHVERASHDLKSVITTYEGKHNHDVPAARNSSHVNSIMTTMAPQPQSVQPQLHNAMARFERPLYGLPGRQQLHGYGYGMNQAGAGGLAHMAMAALGPPNQGKMPVHQYLGQPRPMNEMGFMLPKGEPKVEPGLNLANTSSAYHQLVNR